MNLFLFPQSSIALSPPNWIEVLPTENGIQSYDLNSINYLDKDRLSVKSRYKPISAKSYISYEMIIDCSKQLFKDLTINGVANNKSIWQNSHGDDLINQIIDSTCHSQAN